MWVEVGSQFVRRWRAFFTRLERIHQLDVDNPNHIWLLHFHFLDQINHDCEQFRIEWNAHPISGKGGNRSPNDLRLLGQTEHGVYVDEMEGVPVEELAEYYGVHGQARERRRGQTGAGHPQDEDDDHGNSDHEFEGNSDDGTEEEEAESVPVDESHPPFNEHYLNIFRNALQQVRNEVIIPEEYGILENEWEENGYPTVETIQSGRRRRREITLGLPDNIWRPRAILWIQAVDIMTRILGNID
ncbi:hypothetical protein QCA50_018045 [Cerrena zonata]|uniref:Integrase core domain-containing protein n=1 Tax=Cerrena zonata TaxID=2478898 RepID=A0AAW0FIN5_9APHY